MSRGVTSWVLMAVLSVPVFAVDPAPVDAELDARLRQKVDQFTFDGSFEQALAKWRDLAAVEVRVDWVSLEQAGAGPTSRLRLRVADARAEQVLDLMLRQAAKPGQPLAWFSLEKTVCITTQARALLRMKVGSPALPGRPDSSPKGTAPSVREFSFQNLSVERVFEVLQDVSGANIVVNWPSLEQASIPRDTPVTLKVQNVSIARVLDLVTDQLSGARDRLERVYWMIDDGVVTVATGAALNIAMKVRTYDVSDVLMVIPNAPMPSVQTFGQPQGDSRGPNRDSSSGTMNLFTPPNQPNRPQDGTDQRAAAEQNLIELIKDTIGQDMWQPTGKGTIRIVRGQLIISQTPLGFKLLEQATRMR